VSASPDPIWPSAGPSECLGSATRRRRPTPDPVSLVIAPRIGLRPRLPPARDAAPCWRSPVPPVFSSVRAVGRRRRDSLALRTDALRGLQSSARLGQPRALGLYETKVVISISKRWQDEGRAVQEKDEPGPQATSPLCLTADDGAAEHGSILPATAAGSRPSPLALTHARLCLCQRSTAR
jgi:hypothetical protein